MFGDPQTCQFVQEWEENCGTNTGGACSYNGPGGLHNCNAATQPCADCDGSDPVNGQSFFHDIHENEFGAAGGDKGCGDGDGFGGGDLRGGHGGGRVVLVAVNAGQTGVITINGRVSADGNRGCSQGNDSGGGGAGGTVFIVGDTVNVGPTARVSARGGRGGDSQPKCLPCTSNGDCQSGQTCGAVLDPKSGTSQMRCGPCNCTPCQPPGNTCPAGQTCTNLGGDLGNVCTDSVTGACDPYDPGDNEVECTGTQNSGVCDDCGGGGGGLINAKSRVASVDSEAFFDVRGGLGGICPICAGEAGAGTRELQIDGGYVGEICDGFDNDFNGDRRCVKPDVLSWTSVSVSEAAAVCAVTGDRLCTAIELQRACESAAGNTYPYGMTFMPLACNGLELDGIPGGGDDNVLLATGSLATCVTPQNIFDLSGNAAEWTSVVTANTGPPDNLDIYIAKGGSFETPEIGLTCQFDLSRFAENSILPELGFRCCRD